jgi:multidrug efflux pump subunit AcrB
VGLYVGIDKIQREAFPNVNLDKIIITAADPGASPEDVERLLMIPIEQELKSVDGIDDVTSIAFPGFTQITLELDPDADNKDKIASDVQLAVDRADLPDDLRDDPLVTQVDGRVFPVIQIAVSAPISELQLKQIGDKIEEDLLAIDGVGRVQVQGDRKAEIRVVLDPQKLHRYRLSVGDVAALLRGWNVNASGGDLDTKEGQKVVRIVGEFTSAEQAASLVLRSNLQGKSIRLGDVADVSLNLENAERYYDVSGEPALNFVVLKQADADIINVVDTIKAYLKTVPDRYGANIDINTFQDFSRFARLRLGVLTNNAVVGLFLVFFALILFLRPAVALTTTWGLPIVFFTGLSFLYLTGNTLNLISMMGFIMVLGMIVDDAIILGENITYHMEQGKAPNDAAVIGARELMGPVTTTVTTTIAAFLPMFFISGVMGKLIVAIPIVVISLLVFSWLESFLILPGHVAHFANTKVTPKRRGWLVWLEDVYGKLLKHVVRHHWVSILLAIGILAGTGYIGLKWLSFQLFPPVGIEQFVVRTVAPQGTSLEAMRSQLKEVDEVLRSRIKPEYLEATLITSGQMSLQEGDPLMQRGSRFGQIRVIYTPYQLRPDHDALAEMFRIADYLPRQFPKLDFAFEEIRPGPPTGRALQAEISGAPYPVLEKAATRLADYLQTMDGITTVESDVLPGDKELRVNLDRQLASYAGVDLATTATHIEAAVDGLRVSTTRWGNEEVDVTVRFPDYEGDQLQMLKNLQITNKQGSLVTLGKIASFKEVTGFTAIRHRDNVRIVNVTASVNPKQLTSVELNNRVQKAQAQWLGDLNDKVNITYGGENEKNVESMNDLRIAFQFALIAIFFILAIQFNNLSYPFAVMLAIPFGAVGIILSFYVHDVLWKPMPLSFMSVLGMVALTGVVVNSALVLLVFVQRALAEGQHYHDAIIAAGRRRLRAVTLTAITTILGLLPTAYGWGGLDPFVSPMALALSWGLIFATLITLIVIPAVFAAGVDIKRLFSRDKR